jgi:hypothetical protein
VPERQMQISRLRVELAAGRQAPRD